jgi:hypothetical protein
VPQSFGILQTTERVAIRRLKNKKTLLFKSKQKQMGYSVTACAYVGVTLAASDQQFRQIEAFCQEYKDFRCVVLDYGNGGDSRVRCCVYVQSLELEEWGHSAEIDQNLEENLNVTEAQKAKVAVLLQVINEKPQDMKLVLSLRGC